MKRSGRMGLHPEKDLRYGILVDTDDGLRWVTSIKDKVAEWGEGEAYLTRERENMERVCLGLAVNGTPAFTAIVPPYLEKVGNWGDIA